MTTNSCIVIYTDPAAIEQALAELQTVGCDPRQVSVIASGCQGQDHPVGMFHVGDSMNFLGRQDTFWSNLWHRLSGSAFFWEPEFGTLSVAGPIVKMMVHGLEGVEIGAGFSLPGAALFIVGVPRESINEYEQAIKADKFLLLFQGESQDVEKACGVLHGETQQVTVHRA